MRILSTNLLDTATLSALGTSVNYPLDNLNHPFLKKKFQQTVDGSSGMPDASALTLTWVADQIIDTIIVGYSNATLFTLKLYDSASTLLYTATFSNAEMGATFAAVPGVRSAKLLLDDQSADNPMTVYLGGLGIGASYVAPHPINDWTHDLIDNSFGVTSLDGQVQGQYMEPLRAHVYNFVTASFAVFQAIQAMVKSVGKYTPIWVAPFEQAMATVPPMYAIMEMSSPKKADNAYSWTLTFTEAR